ncbi:hypothetical protein CLHOM_12540 [Clostridium homopropionicum DSM 5847]|uniref:Flavodoxin n=1 Tax=Clostridium homopropionicum DSM 5847 TaxID=1121318 RepID=A0A0L6ZBK9_9CLOT|nr:hypothetical protein [Clostridium homopropionicum]KOA20342.1 hypothetical protein CLHOM_12540 [Clostridium homopropionicum DSM 5847]SFG94138.1 hypothetical protein SAMN04488501_12527 [Clostridium homopropionicum]
MDIAIVSYSYTGNNDVLAECVARDLSAKHIKITVQKPMTMGTIIVDMVFARTPKVHPDPDSLRQYDLILFCAPVWMGHVASPLRTYFRYLKSNPQSYGFLSISGGADGENPKLYRELLKRTGAKPVIVLDQHIKDLISLNSNPTRKDTSAYKISEMEAKRLSAAAIKEINKLSIHG